ncbi:MAG: ABC transporter ATP-binding protein [Candidatus Eremiobacteraeota bacterium]|nr:ABC transporter ATP-binding protein [Candidatus Eremiobacteraeota bacterium]
MSVRRGETFGFLGPNGAGKTTAIKLLLGLTHPTSGEAMVLGARLGDRLTRRRIGYLPELFRYQDWLSAREVLGLHAALADLPASSRGTAIDEALTVVGLAQRADDRVVTFSKGMQQRLGLAVALLGAPDLVFLDEPTSALDPLGRQDVRAVIERLRARGTTVFLNSHLLTEVERVCDRVAVVHRGVVISEGTVADLTRESGAVRVRVAGVTPAVAALLSRNGTAADGWHVVDDIAEEAIPALVASLVAAGARVYAVEPIRQSLEDRFVQLLRSDLSGVSSDASVDSSRSDAP